METGLLWYDGDPKRGLRDKIERAVEHYREKLGISPNTCFVNADMMAEKSIDLAGIRIVTACDVLPDHFWIGIARPSKQKRRKARVRGAR